MTFDAETLAGIVKLANQAQAPHTVQVSDEEQKLYFSDGREKTIEKPPGRRCSVVYSLAAFVDAVNTFSEPEKSVIWHGADSVVLVLDNDDRRDTITLPLLNCKPFNLLCSGGFGGKQASVCSCLKQMFLDAHAPADLRQILQTLDWSVLSSAHGDHRQTTNTMGRSIHAEVKSKSGVEIPELITLSVQVYSTAGADFTADIKCSLDMDIQPETIGIVPLAGEIESAEQWVQNKLADRLTAMLTEREQVIEIPIFWGKA